MRLTFQRFMAILAMLLAMAGCGSKDSTGAQAPAMTVDATASSESGSVRIDYRAEPDPPREGDNEVRVTVTQADGTPMTDAEVSVTYYMPAMPSMSMPEMRDVFPLSHQGQGMYSGTARLSMGGTWQATVTVAQRGETVGKKRFTLIARE